MADDDEGLSALEALVLAVLAREDGPFEDGRTDGDERAGVDGTPTAHKH